MRVLIVEDDLQSRHGLSTLARSVGYEVVAAGDWGEAVRAIKVAPCDLAIIDIGLTHGGIGSPNGLDLIPLVRLFNPTAPVVVITGYGDEQLRETALRRGASLYLEKPLEPGSLMQLMRQLVNTRRSKAAQECPAADRSTS
jgi:DNA-binding response OmpR family regulator